MSPSAQENAARWLVLVATLITSPHLVKADDNYTDYDWMNETQLLQMYEFENETLDNSTESGLDVDVDVDWPELSTHNPVVVGEERKVEWHHHRNFSRVIIMALILHFAIVVVGITIYSCVYFKARTLKIWQRTLESRQRLQLMNYQSHHVPNSRDCPCHGCVSAREMLHGLIMHQWQELAEC